MSAEPLTESQNRVVEEAFVDAYVRAGRPRIVVSVESATTDARAIRHVFVSTISSGGQVHVGATGGIASPATTPATTEATAAQARDDDIVVTVRVTAHYNEELQPWDDFHCTATNVGDGRSVVTSSSQFVPRRDGVDAHRAVQVAARALMVRMTHAWDAIGPSDVPAPNTPPGASQPSAVPTTVPAPPATVTPPAPGAPANQPDHPRAGATRPAI